MINSNCRPIRLRELIMELEQIYKRIVNGDSFIIPLLEEERDTERKREMLKAKKYILEDEDDFLDLERE